MFSYQHSTCSHYISITVATKGNSVCFHGAFGSRSRAEAKAKTVRGADVLKRRMRQGRGRKKQIRWVVTSPKKKLLKMS